MLFWLVLPVVAYADFVWTDNCKKAYQSVWAYNVTQADALLQKEATENPGNDMPLYIHSVKDALRLLFLEDKALLADFKTGTETRLTKLASSDRESPYHFYTRSQLYLHSAIVRIKFGEYVQAAYEIQKSYGLLEAGLKKYPDFLPMQKDLLMMKAAIGTLPDNYRHLLSVLGFTGELKPSISAYSTMLSKMKSHPEYRIFWKEGAVFSSFMQFYLMNDPGKAWKEMEQVTADYSTNLMSAVLRGIMAQRVKKNEIALIALMPHLKSVPVIPMVDYWAAVIMLHDLNLESGFYMTRFLERYKGQNFIKDGYLKLGWAYFLKGNVKVYKDCMRMVQRYGSSQVEEDRQALYEASLTKLPDMPLLKARLLSDGGYFARAKEIILKAKPEALDKAGQAEYYYRKGRIHAALGEDTEALKAYETVIADYTEKEGYFVPAACLYSGMIWEQLGNADKARHYYARCLTYKLYIYKDSFDQKAKAGIARLK